MLLRRNLRFYSKYYRVLGIETSCDDTGVAIVDTNRQILAESIRNQWSLHKTAGFAPQNDASHSGGIIPNLARSLHYYNLIECTSECIERVDKGWDSIDAIALTVKPGLEPCLWEGLKFTRLLLEKYNKIFIPIHHMEAHALTSRLFDSNLQFPYLTLLISGGNCMYALVKNSQTFIRFGETIDMSPGNALDKLARKLGLFKLIDNSPGGALVEKYAIDGNSKRFGQIESTIKHYCNTNKNCDFSFSGIYSLAISIIDKELAQNRQLSMEFIADMCASFQNCILYLLSDRIERGLIYYNSQVKVCSNDPLKIVLAGGVASNKYIFKGIQNKCYQHNAVATVPPLKYCTDNGVMIAWNGCEKLMVNSNDLIKTGNQKLEFKPQGKCDLGDSIAREIEKLEIKLKQKKN